MEKSKLLTIAVFALLLLNLGTLSLLTFAPKQGMEPHGEHREPKYVIIDRLGFDEEQVKEYESLIAWHRGEIHSIEEKIHDTKNRLYLQLLKTKADTKFKDSLIDVLGNYQKQIEETHFRHFQDIKKICKPDQIDKFYELTEDLSRIFSKPPNPQRH